jgi:hypothetical protein
MKTKKSEVKNNSLRPVDFTITEIKPEKTEIKIMKRIYLFFLILICTTTAYSQASYTYPKDVELKNKIDVYLRLMKKADAYEVKTETEIQKINDLKNQAHFYIDSAKVISKKAKRNMSKPDIYFQKLNLFTDFSTSFIRKADSVLIIANAFKDSAYAKEKEAEAFCLAINQEEETNNNPSVLNFVVQLGTGNLESNYFNKVEGVKVVQPNDGVKKFVVGLFNTKKEALACEEKMIQLGYTDSFVRTMESLYK